MSREAILAYAHFLAIGAMLIFIAGQAALCRPEGMGEFAVKRLAHLELVVGIAAVFVWGTGLVRVYLGAKGPDWYWHNQLLHLKIGLFLFSFLLSIKPTLMFRRWRKAFDSQGSYPGASEILVARRFVLVQFFILPLIPLAAVFMARGFGGR